jgi:hypothetical protein
MNRNSAKPGCLALIFPFLRAAAPPSQQNDDSESQPAQRRPATYKKAVFLSPAEVSFYHVLRKSLDFPATIATKVRISDLISTNDNAARNSINQKHVDFVLCDPDTMTPIVAIELDDQSHNQEKTKQRDDHVNVVFAAANIPLARFSAKRAYSIADVRTTLQARLS